MNEDIKKWLFVLAGGVIALAAGIVVIFSERNIEINYTERTQAVVLGYEEDEEYNSSMERYDIVYYPVMKYTAGETEYTERYSQYYSNKKYKPGESVEIRYDPDDPEKFSISEDNRGKIIPAWEIPVGILLTALAVYNLVKIKKKEKEA